jgi:hypothetical protein
MKFAKTIFRIAGILGILMVGPLYFTYHLVARLDPPPVTHPEFYYGFVGVVLVWQFVYIAVGSDPARFRPFMILALLAKLSYVLTIAVLCLQGRISSAGAVTAIPDMIFVVLFLIAFFKTASPLRR